MSETLHIITPFYRVENLLPIMESIKNSKPHNLELIWNIGLQSKTPDPYGFVKRNKMIAQSAGWLWCLDDDNKVHPEFFARLEQLIKDNPDKYAFVFSQDRMSQRYRLKACPENMKVGWVDMAQVVFRSEWLLWPRFIFPNTYTGDGEFYEEIYKAYPDAFYFHDEDLIYYNALRTGKMQDRITPVTYVQDV